MTRSTPDCAEPDKALLGRPTLHTDELALKLCIRLADGESLRAICDDDDMPDRETVRRWVRDNPIFRGQYVRAREDQADTDADDIGHIARKIEKGEIEPSAGTAAINALKWTAGRRAPRKYGDRMALVGGGPGDPPIRFDLTNLSDEELEALDHIRSKLADSDGDQGGASAAEG